MSGFREGTLWTEREDLGDSTRGLRFELTEALIARRADHVEAPAAVARDANILSGDDAFEELPWPILHLSDGDDRGRICLLCLDPFSLCVHISPSLP